MTLRSYQRECMGAIVADINTPGASLCVLPTGSGKSHIIAAAALLKRPVLILCPSRELLLQNHDKLAAVVPESEIGIYSASFLKREIKLFTLATIQSVYKYPELFIGTQLVIIDECHGVSPSNLKSMYTSFLGQIGNPKVIGLTASPYRLETVYESVQGQLYASTGVKMVNRMYMKGTHELFWKHLIYNVSHKTLLDQGYLVPLQYIHQPLLPYEEIPVNKSHSDFNLEAYSESIIGFESEILRTVAEAQAQFKSVLVFCADTDQAKRLSEVVKGSAYVLGDSDKKERTKIIADFKSGAIKTIFNVNCLSTGFDHPALDCIILLRPVRSPILYQQMLGRLTRTAAYKTHGTVIDLTGSCKSLGAIESFEVFMNTTGWDVRSSRVSGFHGRTLFKMKIQK